MAETLKLSESKRVRKVRKRIAGGLLNCEVPAEREGYHQHVCLDASGKVNKLLNSLAYDYRLGPDGKPLKIQGKNNEKFFVLETPQETWEEALKERHKEANESLELMKRKMSGDGKQLFADGRAEQAEMTRISKRVPKDED